MVAMAGPSAPGPGMLAGASRGAAGVPITLQNWPYVRGTSPWFWAGERGSGANTCWGNAEGGCATLQAHQETGTLGGSRRQRGTKNAARHRDRPDGQQGAGLPRTLRGAWAGAYPAYCLIWVKQRVTGGRDQLLHAQLRRQPLHTPGTQLRRPGRGQRGAPLPAPRRTTHYCLHSLVHTKSFGRHHPVTPKSMSYRDNILGRATKASWGIP